MKIVVCIKQVPDSTVKLPVEQNCLSLKDVPLVINPWDEFAVEAALKLKDLYEGEVIALTFGSESSREVLQRAIAMGCDSGILVINPKAENFDSESIATVLTTAIRKIGEVSIALFGRQAIDSEAGVTPAQISRKLRWPLVTLVSEINGIDIDSGTIVIEQALEEGHQIVQASLPIVISVNKDIGEPRYPSFMGIRKASKLDLPCWSLSDLQIASLEPLVEVLEQTSISQREIRTEMLTGETEEDLANQLVDIIFREAF